MTYEERMKRAKLIRQLRLSIYIDALYTAFEENMYDDLPPIEKIQVLTVINKHADLENRIEC
tara:strand:+ start:234 stop:419 length:186 start_codon:yes stop_codon:yes gene_type:complete